MLIDGYEKAYCLLPAFMYLRVMMEKPLLA